MRNVFSKTFCRKNLIAVSLVMNIFHLYSTVFLQCFEFALVVNPSRTSELSCITAYPNSMQASDIPSLYIVQHQTLALHTASIKCLIFCSINLSFPSDRAFILKETEASCLALMSFDGVEVHSFASLSTQDSTFQTLSHDYYSCTAISTLSCLSFSILLPCQCQRRKEKQNKALG